MALLHLILLCLISFSAADLRVPKSEAGASECLQSKALSSDGHFTVLLGLLKNVDVISGAFKKSRGLTLFAPTDDAFAEAGVQQFLQKLTREQMIKVLEYHALSKYYRFARFEKLLNKMIPTIASGDNKSTFQLSITPGYYVNTTRNILSRIVAQAFDAHPVAVYVCDKVLFPKDIVLPSPPHPPPADASVAVQALSALKASPFFKTFSGLLTDTQVTGYLESLPAFTLFAPSDKAFQSLTPKAWSKINENNLLSTVLNYHAVPVYSPPWSLKFIKEPLQTLAGFEVRVNYMGGLKVAVETGLVESYIVGIVFNDKPVVIYAVDQVLLPKALF